MKQKLPLQIKRRRVRTDKLHENQITGEVFRPIAAYDNHIHAENNEGRMVYILKDDWYRNYKPID